ncbi:MAG TPA: glycerol-3-phosphate 1-O-acyltransferase PlsY [Terriglobales bacterium]|nr:glycerol-3-phosphate 1-O-acyltransferase PlsY [Terriglobales bacterium]
MRPILLTIVASYLLGSIPFGYLLVRKFIGKDVRSTGSGNIGATNVARTSPKLGAITLILDALKGAAAVALAMLIAGASFHPTPVAGPEQIVAARKIAERVPDEIYLFAVVAALFAIVGHIFPVWLKFRGGKGVATAVGSFLLLAPQAVLASLFVFFLVAITSRYVSLSSVLSAALFPFFAWFFYRDIFQPPMVGIAAIAALLVICRHHENLTRLARGNEPRFQLGRG